MEDPNLDAAEIDIIAMILQQDMTFCSLPEIFPDFVLTDRYQLTECG